MGARERQGAQELVALGCYVRSKPSVLIVNELIRPRYVALGVFRGPTRWASCILFARYVGATIKTLL